MKTVLFVLLALVSINSFAANVTYRLFEDSLDQFTPFTLTLELDGEFTPGSKVKSVVIKEVLRTGETVLFKFSGKTLNDAFGFRWVGKNLGLTGKGGNFKAAVKKPVSNGWGDTDIAPGDEYSTFTEEELILTKTGSVNEVRFEIANQTVEEVCLWGILKK